MDDMEAALFASFASKQQQRGRRGRRKTQEQPDEMPDSEPRPPQTDKTTLPNEKTKARERAVKPRTFEFSQDDLAGLLSDSDSDSQPAKKPVLRAKGSSHALTNTNNLTDTFKDDNPITSTPKLNGQVSMTTVGTNEDPRQLSANSPPTIADGESGSRGKSKVGVSPRKQNSGAIKFNDADTDDLLGDLGLGEDDYDSKPPPSSQRPGSVATVATTMPTSLRTPTPGSSVGLVRKEAVVAKGDGIQGDSNLDSDHDGSAKEDGGDDGFSFGGYLPSVGSSTPARKPLGLSFGKREESVHGSLALPLQSRSSPRAKTLARDEPGGGHLGSGETRKKPPPSTRKLVRFALEEDSANVTERAKPPADKGPRVQGGSGELAVTPGNPVILPGNRSLSIASPANNSSGREGVSEALVTSSETAEPILAPITAPKRDGSTSGRRTRRRRTETTIQSSSRSLFDSDDEDTPKESERIEALDLTAKLSKEMLNPTVPENPSPPSLEDPKHQVSLTSKVAAGSNSLDKFRAPPAQSSSSAGLQQEQGRKGASAKPAEVASVGLQRTPTQTPAMQQSGPGADNMEMKYTIATLQKQLESAREELASERTDNERLKKMLASLQSTQSDQTSKLSGELEELRVKLRSAELEREQVSSSLEICKRHHSEELQTVEESAKRRIQAMAEAHERMEERLKGELAAMAGQQKAQVEEIERRGEELATSLRKQLESLEVAKESEIARTKEIHQSAMKSMRQEHAREVEQLTRRHGDEIAAMKEAHSHARKLSELSQQVETSVQKVSHLQARLGETHEHQRQEKEHGLLAKEHQLSVLEQRLESEKSETSREQKRLHSLIAMLETQLSEKQRDMDKERWQLQQECSRLRARQSAFETEKESALDQIREDHDQLQQAKENFLKEQQAILSRCYADKEALSGQRAGVAALEKAARGREMEESFRRKQIEAREHELEQEHQMLVMERRQLQTDADRAHAERERLEEERRRFAVAEKELEHRAREVDSASRRAEQLQLQSQQALEEVHHRQLELTRQTTEIGRQREQIKEKEMSLARERLNLLREQREAATRNKKADLIAGDGLNEPVATIPTPFQGEHLSFLPSRSFLSSPSPSRVPLHSPGPFSSASRDGPALEVSGDLADLQLQQTLRKLTAEVEKDRDALEEERKFLEAIQLGQPSRPLFML